MGLEWMVVDPNRRKTFDLGKGVFYKVFMLAGEWRTPLAIQTGGVESFIKSMKEQFDEDDVDLGFDTYVERVAKKVWQFLEDSNWQFYIISDASADEEFTFEEVGTRYEE